MTKKPKDKKVDHISSTTRAREVQGTQNIEEVEKVEKTGSISGVGGVRGVGKAGAVSAMSFEQRERLLSLISEEAGRLTKEGAIPQSQRAVVEQAVKMVIDAALLDLKDEGPGSKRK